MCIGVDLTEILGGTHGGTYYKSPAVKAKKHIFLHCNASNLVLKILQHDKIWGDNPPAPNSEGLVLPVLPVIYAHVYVPKYTVQRVTIVLVFVLPKYCTLLCTFKLTPVALLIKDQTKSVSMQLILNYRNRMTNITLSLMQYLHS